MASCSAPAAKGRDDCWEKTVSGAGNNRLRAGARYTTNRKGKMGHWHYANTPSNKRLNIKHLTSALRAKHEWQGLFQWCGGIAKSLLSFAYAQG